MLRLAGRVALVTGAANGIGEAVSKKLAEHGMKVVGCDMDEVGLSKMEKHMNDSGKIFRGMKCDLRKEEDILAVFQRIKDDPELGVVDVCVSSAGLGHKASLLQGETWQFREMFEVNTLACVICAREAVKLMKERGVDDGHLFIINSGAGHCVRGGNEEMTHFDFYNATKHALTAITEGIRNELRMMKSNIRVGQISPEIVETSFTHKMYPGEGGKVDEFYYKNRPSLKADDVADGVLYALSCPAHVQVHDIYLEAI